MTSHILSNPATPDDGGELRLAEPLHPRAGIYQAKLTSWAKYVATRFNAYVYLVGSVLTSDEPRDVDLRAVMDYDEYWARYPNPGDLSQSWSWVRECAKAGAQAARALIGNGNYCRAVDFQVENDVAAIAHKGKPRVLLASPNVGAPLPEPPAVLDHLVWSYEHDAWWGPDECGYNPNVFGAGLYTREQAHAIADGANRHATRPKERAVALADALRANDRPRTVAAWFAALVRPGREED